MPTFTADAYLVFAATDNGSSLTPISNWTHLGTNWDVFDNGDGNADTSTDYYINSTITYTGYTIELSGQDYAIFSSGDGNYFVPYFDPAEGFAALSGTPVTQTITQSGENANVVNLCFAAGTLIATPDGETTVEDLRIGDYITTTTGQAVPVKWIGRQLIRPRAANIALDEKLAPVCIAAGTLGNHTDLYVSADHGMIVDDLLINASALVNGTTVRFVRPGELPENFTYYHVETENHDVILANGAPAETFIDAAGRTAFDNYQEYLDLYGAERIIPEMTIPRITSARLVPQTIKVRLCEGTERASVEVA